MRRRSETESLATLLTGMLNRQEYAAVLGAQLVISRWPEVVGPTIAKVTRVRSVRDRQLNVTVKSAVWAQELAYQKSAILRRLNAGIHDDPLRDIVFTIGSLKDARTTPDHRGDTRAIPSDELQRVRLSRNQEQVLSDLAQSLPDPELAALLERLARHGLQALTWREQHGYRTCTECSRQFRGHERICPVCRGR